MSRHALFATVLLAAMAQTCCALDYFLDSEQGSDKNAGTSIDAPWASLARLAKTALQPGDVVHLRRGHTFRGRLVFRGNGAEGKPIRITAYGKGCKPEILGSIRLTNWTRHEGDVFKCAVPASAFVGRRMVYSAYEYDDNKVPVRLVRDKAMPDKPGHFFFDKDALTLYAITSDRAAPASHRIEASVVEQLVLLTNRCWIEIEGLAFLFGNCRHVGFINSHDMLLQNCASLFVGMYGNPNVMILRNSTRVRVLNCFLYENVNCGVLLSSGATRNVIANCTIVKCASNDGVTLHSGGRDKNGVRQGITGDYNVVENNVIGLCPEESIDITSGDYHAIRGNICYGDGNPGIIVGHDADHILIQNNICFHNARAGIQVSGNEAEGARGHNRVVQNLVFDNGYPGLEIQAPFTQALNNTVLGSRERVAVRINAKARGSVLRNNLVVTLDPRIRFASLQFLGGTPKTFDVRLDHNLFFHVAKPTGRLLQTNEGAFTVHSFAEKYATGEASLCAPPRLNHGPEGYYFLDASSPAVDAGADVGLPFAGKAPDLGWKELGREAGAPHYPKVLIDGKDDDAAILYLWGKTATPPREAVRPGAGPLDADFALARGKEFEAKGDWVEAAIWYNAAASSDNGQAQAAARLAALLAKREVQDALRLAEAEAALERARFFLSYGKRKLGPGLHYLGVARACATAGSDAERAAAELWGKVGGAARAGGSACSASAKARTQVK